VAGASRSNLLCGGSGSRGAEEDSVPDQICGNVVAGCEKP
jgi:hypothetical protein